ncbi:MAG: hypothetical protein HRT95_11685 [Moritella sp.]|uniref:hypothetical protein n=1 Tax=Moritella sp. TaxID=78556 RepID=UPI001E08AAC3|nr:hypothetical protein [Moritella sp.]NQZ50799.1 hypothetical protein [Moritella sp.]
MNWNKTSFVSCYLDLLLIEVIRKLTLNSKALNDSRSFILKLSETGKDLTLQAISVVEEIDDKVFGSLGTAKKEKFLSLILEFNRFN